MPTIADDYAKLAERIGARLRRPRVRGLWLPPARSAADKDAEFCALELDDGSIGLSYVWLEDTEARLRRATANAELAGTDAVALARGYVARDPAAKALGFAAINALSQSLFARAAWSSSATGDSLAGIAPVSGEHLGMIGLFLPLIERIDAAGARLTVLELKPELARDHGRYRVTLDPAALASCDKVVSTCSVLLNDTLDAVLAACRHARRFALIGPSAGCVPDPLFARGVDALGGRRIVDRESFRDALQNGAKWGTYAEKYVIERGDYPGVDGLIERLR